MEMILLYVVAIMGAVFGSAATITTWLIFDWLKLQREMPKPFNTEELAVLNWHRIGVLAPPKNDDWLN